MKRKLINSFIILSGSTLITKVFSVFNRMLLSRLLSEQGMALYILVIPTLSLCITLAQFSIPSAVFRLISHPKYNNKKVIISAILICFASCLLIMLSILCFSQIIAHDFLKQDQAYYPLLTMLPFIPLVAISGIIKNYYLGKEDVWTLSVAQLLEEVARIIFTYFMIKSFVNLDMTYLVSIAILAMSVGELASIIYLYFKMHRKVNVTYHPIEYFKDHFILHTCYNFIEPIVLVAILTKLNINESDIHMQYAIISGYVISLLVTPTFFNNVVLRLLLPILNKDIAYRRLRDLRKHVIYGVIVCFLISLPFTLLFYFWGDKCLLFMYNTNNGYDYLKYMSIPFTLFYLQTPLSATLQALNKNKEMLTPRYHVLSVAMVMLIGLFTTLVLSIYHVYKYVYREA